MSEQTMTIYDLKAGSTGRVSRVHASDSIRQRLFDMGVVPSSTVSNVRRAIGGDPIWINVNGVQIALRKEEACAVDIEIA